MLEFLTLAAECAPTVAPQTMAALVATESSFNPLAIGVVDGYLPRQPESIAEAVATAKAMQANGWNFSIGLAQVNIHNLPTYRLTIEQAFEPCANLSAGAAILAECYTRALPIHDNEQSALRAALSCYYSGNFTRGFRLESSGTSYVDRVLSRSVAAEDR